MLYARPGLPGTDPTAIGAWQPLVEHLRSVADISGQLSRACSSDEAFGANAIVMGFLHDVGKATADWQAMLQDSVLRGIRRRVPHAAHGAALAREMGLLDVAFAIAGHHAGVPNKSGANALEERCDDYLMAARGALDSLVVELTALGIDHASFLRGVAARPKGYRAHLGFDMRVRMLASILADADRTNSATRTPVYKHRTLTSANEMLRKLIDETRTRSSRCSVVAVRNVRQEVLQRCIEAGSWDERLLTLNAPTGSGKTLATFAFALARAVARPKAVRRVVVVVPYLSIIEQNAIELARIVGTGDILEHHSGNLVPIEDEEEASVRSEHRRLLTQNWNVPVVVTTSVRFFETLFSNHPGDLRRLHSIANSVIIFDEVQTLPRQYLAPMWSALRALVDDWGVTCLLSSATLPDFDAAVRPIEKTLREGGNVPVRELLTDRAAVHSSLRRVRVTWPEGPPGTIDGVGAAIARHPRVLAVVNRKDDALQLFGAVRQRSDSQGRVWHLSTNMCPQHRTDSLRMIRSQLGDGGECRVISTQLIEAGVDIDFPVVYRAIAPLDSIAQAAGRCDREGRLTAAAGAPAGEVVVFDLGPMSDHPAGTAYGQGSESTRELLRHSRRLDLADPRLFDAYYADWLGENRKLDAKAIQSLRKTASFADVAEAFRYIDQPTRSVIVPYGEEGVRCVDRLRDGRLPTPNDWAVLQRHSVPVFPGQLTSLAQCGVIYRAFEELDIWVCESPHYNEATGLQVVTDGPSVPFLEV